MLRCIGNGFYNVICAVYRFAEQHRFSRAVFPIYVCHIRLRRSAINNRIVIVNNILDSADVVYVPHAVVGFTVFSVTAENVFRHS